MSKRSYVLTEPLFSAGTKRGQQVAAAKFRCASCNSMTVRTAGSTCTKCLASKAAKAAAAKSKGGRKR